MSHKSQLVVIATKVACALKENRGWYTCLQLWDGGIAQLGEHLPCKQGVKSSNLFISTNGSIYVSKNFQQ